jgi:hypothetical protein
MWYIATWVWRSFMHFSISFLFNSLDHTKLHFWRVRRSWLLTM